MNPSASAGLLGLSDRGLRCPVCVTETVSSHYGEAPVQIPWCQEDGAGLAAGEPSSVVSRGPIRTEARRP
ncbi:hypothetical protein EYF80_041608 [Liparis tanakae]|uniref:Uncharacterized protein n=1 Tax=Liparis tanakae TaxID=230148 RepID=A0A4Z2G3P4_9TELE|nr:hypothetical protein EYF80_041608 [Liparis tanakae]